METTKLGTELRRQLAELVNGGQAHATFDEAAKDFPAELRGVAPAGLPYSGWQIVEHMRIAQHDILCFSDNADGSYKELKWPDDYWPKDAKPPHPEAWDETLAKIRADRDAFDALLYSASDEQLVEAFPWGETQNLLREALLIADHNAYHTGELIVIRRLLGVWKK